MLHATNAARRVRSFGAPAAPAPSSRPGVALPYRSKLALTFRSVSHGRIGRIYLSLYGRSEDMGLEKGDYPTPIRGRGQASNCVGACDRMATGVAFVPGDGDYRSAHPGRAAR